MVSFSYAGSLNVIPTKIFLSGGKKTGSLKITNQGEEAVTLQVEASKWAQSENGEDVYEATDDIVFYPKIFTIEKGKQTLLRIGTKNQKSDKNEATYRVFIQEIPVSKPGSSGLTMALRLSIPIFIKPEKEISAWVIENAEQSSKGILVKIKNTGNGHVLIGKINAEGLDGSGNEAFNKEEPGWYVLQGMAHVFVVKVPGKECRESSVIKITVEAEGASKETRLTTDKGFCPLEGEAPKGLDERRNL